MPLFFRSLDPPTDRGTGGRVISSESGSRAVYRCPHCNEASITPWRKAWVAYIARSTTCPRCGGSAGISNTVRYLSNAPLLLFAFALYFYFSRLSDAELRSRQTFWLLIVGLLVVPTVYGLIVAALRLWLAPLVRR